MILADYEIKQLANEKGLIEPFTEDNQNIPNTLGTGLSSFGYDLSLSEKDFKIFQYIPGQITDPKNFNENQLMSVNPIRDHTGCFFILPSHSYGLGVAKEKIHLPFDSIAIALGKSTYARSGIHCNVTPAEPGFEGYLTLELSNSTPQDCKVYANEGICQLIFLVGNTCSVSYRHRGGKYQNQKQEVVMSKVN